MPVRTTLWRVGTSPQVVPEAALESERLLEDMIVAAPQMLSDEWMLIGRQEETGLGGRVDLLAIAPDCSLVVIELKRNRTPRDVLAQALDYASWAESLRADEIDAIYSRFSRGGSLRDDFRKRFSTDLDDEALNTSHQVIVVASHLDDSTERIARYLSKRDVPINVLMFQVFGQGNEQLISRTWLLDPIHTQVNSVASVNDGPSEPWNGEWYCSFGDARSRSWSDAVEFGFVSAGGGPWYSRTLQQLNPDDRVWVNVPRHGYVGVGRVLGRVQPAAEFKVRTPAGETPILDVAKRGNYHREFVNDPEKSEYFVPIRWLDTVPLDRAIDEVGLFGNQNTICAPKTPKWRATVERLRQRFPGFDKP